MASAAHCPLGGPLHPFSLIKVMCFTKVARAFFASCKLNKVAALCSESAFKALLSLERNELSVHQSRLIVWWTIWTKNLSHSFASAAHVYDHQGTVWISRNKKIHLADVCIEYTVFHIIIHKKYGSLFRHWGSGRGEQLLARVRFAWRPTSIAVDTIVVSDWSQHCIVQWTVSIRWP